MGRKYSSSGRGFIAVDFGGGGGGGTSNYNDLSNQPQINGVTLTGNKTLSDLGLATITYKNADSVADLPTPASSESPYIYLIPSTNNPGTVDQYACIEDAVVEGQVIPGWSWVLIGSTSPIVSVQELDVFASLIPVVYSGQLAAVAPGNSGLFVEMSNNSVYEFDISGVNQLKVSFGTITSSTAYSIGFYDSNGFMDGESLYPMNSNNAVIVEDAIITPPNGAVMMRINESNYQNTHGHPCIVIGTASFSEQLFKKQANPNTIIYGEVTIDADMPLNFESSNEITRNTKLSGFGIMFPTNYSNVGTPTQVIAMLHGASGYVSPSCLGYTGQEWVTWRNQYLSAGFAVMDINGFGVSTSNDQYSQPYGNPQSAETLYKAFEYIRKIYNVNDKLLLHGTSMGGANAFSFLKSHPDMVAGVGLFAPANIPYGYIFTGWTGIFQALAWGYTNKAEAIADNFSHLVGWQTMMEDDFDWENMDSSEFAAITSKTYVPSVPIRIWQGTSDTNVPLALNQKLCECLRRANIPVTLRVCTGADHNMSGGAVEYVRNEAVSWFKRFVNL